MTGNKKASTASLKQVVELLQHELTLCQELLTILQREFDVLKRRGEVSEFDAVIQQKQECAAQLEKNELELFRIITADGFSQSKQGLQDFLDSIDVASDSHNIKPTWVELRTRIVECQRQNQVNGRILNISLINTQQALNLLCGRDISPPVYDNQGKATDKDSNHSIAIA